MQFVVDMVEHLLKVLEIEHEHTFVRAQFV